MPLWLKNQLRNTLFSTTTGYLPNSLSTNRDAKHLVSENLKRKKKTEKKLAETLQEKNVGMCEEAEILYVTDHWKIMTNESVWAAAVQKVCVTSWQQHCTTLHNLSSTLTLLSFVKRDFLWTLESHILCESSCLFSKSKAQTVNQETQQWLF